MYRPSALMLLLLACAPVNAAPLGIGTPPSPALLQAWDIDVRPDGRGLPAGSGSVAEGEQIYARRCASCHGAKGEGGPQDRLVGGKGSLTTSTPMKTVGSFWPYATTLFDYVRRAMPFDAPQSLSAEEVYAVVAYVLYLNGIVAADTTVDAESLPRIAMPNARGFFSSPW